MPLSFRRARTSRRRDVAIALALPFVAAVAVGCSSLRAAARAPDARVAEPGAPASFVRSTSDARSTRLIDLRDGLTKPLAWRTALEVLGAEHTVDVRDETAGFAMTPWEATVVRDGVPDLRYRTRVTVRFVGDEWKQLQVRAEANWRSRGDEWDVGFDEALLEKLTSDLQSRLGKRAGAAP
jgi:CO/xanthine dehydrogenase Mo-binding subunit